MVRIQRFDSRVPKRLDMAVPLLRSEERYTTMSIKKERKGVVSMRLLDEGQHRPAS
jgi:hypothetical protein